MFQTFFLQQQLADMWPEFSSPSATCRPRPVLPHVISDDPRQKTQQITTSVYHETVNETPPFPFASQLVAHRTVLTRITQLGMIISLICLSMCIFTFWFFSEIQSTRTTIHKNLCCSLFMAEFVFLVGINMNTHKVSCGWTRGNKGNILLVCVCRCEPLLRDFIKPVNPHLSCNSTSEDIAHSSHFNLPFYCNKRSFLFI